MNEVTKVHDGSRAEIHTLQLSKPLQPKGITPSEAHVGREFDILNVPRVGNLTQPPSWKVEDQGMHMSDKRSAILENTQ